MFLKIIPSIIYFICTVLTTSALVVFYFSTVIPERAPVTMPINEPLYNKALERYYQIYSAGYKASILVLVDFSLPSNVPRLWIINAHTGQVLFNTYVTHGTGSGELYATSFGNDEGSHKSSLGAAIIVGSYYGEHGISLKLAGMDATNSNMESRKIVIHSADYIGDGKTGRSWGCFAIPTKDMYTVYGLIHNGAVLYAGI